MATGLALAMVVGAGVNAKTALATSYLASPNLYNTATSGAFQFDVNGDGVIDYATGNSSYGNTIPTVSQLSTLTGIPASKILTVTDGINSSGTANTTFYSSAGLVLSQIATQNNPYSFGPSSNGTVVTGNVISNVFQVESGSTMSGVAVGNLIFTYQFDVTGIPSYDNGGMNNAILTYFNDPNGALYNLGLGINDTPLGSTGSFFTSANGTEITLSATQLEGTVTYASNGSISSLAETVSGNVPIGTYTPQFFLASNAYSYTMGTVALNGSGVNGNVNVFVPNGTPEPGTLVLFGTGIAFLSFMVLRKKVATLEI